MNRCFFVTAVGLVGAAEVHADTAVYSAAPQPTTDRSGLAVGVELGEPSALTLGWWFGSIGVSGAIGTGTFAGVGVSAHVDVQLEVARLSPALSLAVGLGGRIYHHGYEPMSFDEVPDTHYGARATAALAYDHDALRFYLEAAPGVDLHRTASCTLGSGPYSICPHAQALPLFLQVVIGARWFFDKEQP